MRSAPLVFSALLALVSLATAAPNPQAPDLSELLAGIPPIELVGATGTSTTDPAPVSATDGGNVVAPTTSAAVVTTTSAAEAVTTTTSAAGGFTPIPTPGTDAEQDELDCYEVVDDTAAFDCVDVNESELNGVDVDCVDELIEPDFDCQNVNPEDITCEPENSGTDPSYNNPANASPAAGSDPNAVEVVSPGADASQAGLTAGAYSIRSLPLFQIVRDSLVVGAALFAGAAMVL